MQGEAKEEVRARLNIEDVIGEYVQLKRAGRNFKGLSPFTSERTPSFVVSPDKHIWHDFSSNRGGDIFGFIMEVEGMDFRQALEHLARKAGVDLSLYQSSGNQKVAQRKKRFLEMHVLATRYFQRSMVENRLALEYVFAKRKLSKQVATDFQIGYAPDSRDGLTSLLKKRGYSAQEIAEAGLASRYGNDLFRGRMMVPLMDQSGQVIGYTGRIIGEVENAPKYLNTPQTLLYDKSRHIFGFSQAKEAIRSKGYAVIVEGNLDVVSSHQVDVREVVATAGTAMTEQHLKGLKRLTADIRLCYDRDKAGIAASERAIGLASELGVELTIINLPGDAKDPDELIQKDPSLWQRAIDNAEPAVDWIMNQYAERYDLASASGKRAFTTAALAVTASLADPVEREHYEALVAKKVGTTLTSIKQKTARIKSGDNRQSSTKPIADSAKGVADGSYSYQDELLAVMAIEPTAQELLQQMDIGLLAGAERQELARYMAKHSGKLIEDTPTDLQSIDTYVKIVLLRADTRFAALSEQDRYFEAARLIRHVEHENKKQMRDRLTDELRVAERDEDEGRADELRSELNVLIKEIARGKK